VQVGLFDWLKRKDAGDASAMPDAVTARDVQVDLQDPQQRAALEQADHLLHELLAGGAGQGSVGGLTVTASTQVIVDGQTVTSDDPRAREAMSKAAAKLRAQGMDELAADLEARAASVPAAMAPAVAAGTPPPPTPAPAPGGDELSLPAPGEDDQTPPVAGAEDELGAAPNAPAPPEPPAPPS
jgi:hypothetical protein